LTEDGGVARDPTRRLLFRLALVAGGMALSPSVALGRPGPSLPEGLTPGEQGRVAAVLSGDTLDLDGGLRVRLAGIRAPAPARHDRPAPPWAAEATTATRRFVLGETVRLHYADDRRDRWNRALAHVVRPDGAWLQAHLLMQGLARVYTWPRTATGGCTLLDLERTARAGRAGLWADRFYRIRNPGETWGDLDSWQIVEGRVAIVRGTGYLNFGRDWRNDFTFRLESPVRRAFKSAGLEIADLIGRRVRGRGWIYPLNGPMIDLTHTAQLEVLEE
jgi:endonuclease YncB( thermonuclease family)